MTKGDFAQLVEKYWLGQCTPAEIAFVEEWLKFNEPDPSQHLSVFETQKEAEEMEYELWENITENSGIENTRSRKYRLRWLSRGIAAAIIGFAATYLLNNQYKYFELVSVPSRFETVNSSTSRQRITLPDCSTVTLSEGASISLADGFGNQTRIVHLKGEAFFEIQPDPSVPFLVYSGDLVTEVLGTSFLIKPGSNTIEVAVATGKVSVYSNEKDRNQRRKGVIITPNQRAIYNLESKTIQQDIVDNPQIVNEQTAPNPNFNFDETPLSTVLTVLKKAYGTDIMVSNPTLNNCVFTGNLNGYDLFKQLSYICNTIEAQYEVRGTTIFLTGEGCSRPL